MGEVATAMMNAGREAIGAGVPEFEVAIATSQAGTRKAVLSCVDGSVYARFFSTDVDHYEERSCVRPVGAVYITAGLDEVRVPGP